MQKMLCEENIVLVKRCTKVSVTYATFSSYDFLLFIFTRLFLEFFFLHDIFLPETLKTKKTFEWGKNEKLEANLEVIVNSVYLLPINFRVPFRIMLFVKIALCFVFLGLRNTFVDIFFCSIQYISPLIKVRVKERSWQEVVFK